MAAPQAGTPPGTRGHKKYRAALKKEKRKTRRQELARLRDSGLSPKEEEEEEESCMEREERLLAMERQRLHEQWLLREQKAQEEFRIKKEKEAAARKWQEGRESAFKGGWEEQQRRERAEEPHKLPEKRGPEAAAPQRLRLRLAGNGPEDGAARPSPAPPAGPGGAEDERALCPFYSKTGACRFGDRCARRHRVPTSSRTLLIRSLFTTFGMEQCRRDDYDPDAGLEDSEEETYQQFLDFYEDVLPEFRNVGKVVQFKVSCNVEPHLWGNVYVQYQSEEECRAALSLFHGRWYAGRQLQCELCPVTRWQMAICGLYETQQCPRGKHCNFLHVFRNPNNEFWEANRDIYRSPDRNGSSLGKNSDRRDGAGRHDEYYGRPRPRRGRSPTRARSHRRNGEAERKRRGSHRGKKSHKHRSRSGDRHSCRSRGRKRGRSHHSHSRSRSQSHRSHSRCRCPSRSRSRGKRWSDSRDGAVLSPKCK